MTELEKIQEVLTDDLFPDSKDWVRGNTLERVGWLLSMYRSQKAECDMVWDMLDKAQEHIDEV